MTSLEIGIDTGGTFCDFVARGSDGRIETTKISSTPRQPATAIGEGLRELIARFEDVTDLRVTVGTTVAINALIERRGPRVLFITNEGFTDVPFIARMDKASLYDLHWSRPKPMVRRRDSLGVQGRIDHHGREIEPFDSQGLRETLSTWVESDVVVAVCMLFSYLTPEHEQQASQIVREVLPNAAISVSHDVSPVWREYERASTTIADAFVKLVVDDYVIAVDGQIKSCGVPASWRLLASNGGYLSADQARTRPIQIMLSGLAGGVVGATEFANQAGTPSLFTLDMGGTSCDVGLIVDGRTEYRDEFELAFGIPVTVPSVAVETIGAGGGSILHIDAGGLLHVGPRSAGADPGPIAYGRGGIEPTLTDANLVLGRLDADTFLGGRMTLDTDAAIRAFSALGSRLGGMSAQDAALAATRIADESLANAVRLVAVDRGLDPREFAIMAFGGAGPLHACEVARRMDITTVVVPPGPGLCSAFGALVAPARVDRVRTVSVHSSGGVDRLERADSELQALALADLAASLATGVPRVERFASMRYAGQNFNLDVRLPDLSWRDGGWSCLLEEFEREHKAKYGFALEGEPIEVIQLRVTARADEPYRPMQRVPGASRPDRHRLVWFTNDQPQDCRIVWRSTLVQGEIIVGPAIIEEEDSTTLVGPDDVAHVDRGDILRIEIGSRQ